MNAENQARPLRKPAWLKKRLPSGPWYEQTRSLLHNGHLHTVCEEAGCPNMFECFSKHTATFLILGNRCTRACTFCAVQHGPRQAPDPNEPLRVAKAAAEMGLTYVVVTSVTRDDLRDGGASVFSETIQALRRYIPEVAVEVLIPDFQGEKDALETVLKASPHVLNHNLETVERLYAAVRPQADYHQSLRLLQRSRQFAPSIFTKSGLMLGLGEKDGEIQQALEDLRQVHCRILTLGQYLSPGSQHHPVMDYVTPEHFEKWRDKALHMGFTAVASGPFVRSSYQAREIFRQL
jgi:lipoic acid synthetase